MSRRHFNRNSLMGILVTSAVAGVGLSFGRDVYRKTRNNFVFLLLAAIALAGTSYGVWNMVRGHDRGPIATIFRTYILNGLIILVSVVIFALFANVVSGDANPANVSRFIILGEAAFVGLGLLIGLKHRHKRLRAFAIDRHNEGFLEREGFRDVGGRDQVMIDPSGNELTLDDFRADAVTFKVLGRRGARARILLDNDGRMVEYVPA
ncbi:hypothetical protein NKI25_31795 [Mesorhizobium sp. M0808]|uniref:hypothetical protein n=1 Tax=Mesorhizobium sp. M0808 TaxID=2957002 RepID=UPI003335C449